MAITDGYKVLIGADTTKLVTDVQNATSKMTATVKVDADGNSIKQLNTEVKTFTDSSGRMWQNVEKTSQAINSQTGELEGNKKVISSTTKEITKASTATKTWGDKFVDITKKVVAFGTATQVIMLFRQAIDLAKDAVFEFDGVMTEFNKVSDLSGESLSTYVDELNELGEAVARTGAEMLESAGNAVKAGYTEEEAQQLSTISALYQNIADSVVESGDAMTFVVAQMKAFDIEAEDSIQILDSLNNVANNMSVSSTDLATALSKNATSIGSYGNSIHETIALEK